MIKEKQDNKTLIDKCKAFLGIQTVYLYFMMIFTCFYLIYRSIRMDKKALFLLLSTNIYHKLLSEKSPKMRQLLQWSTKWFKKFEIVAEESISEQGCMLPIHPHSIVGFGPVVGSLIEGSELAKCQLLGTSFVTEIAPHGILAQGFGIKKVNPEHLGQLMKSRRSVSLVPGGYEEATLTSEKEYRCYLKNRKGFVKFALMYGYKLHPVFVFNENKCFKVTDTLMNFRLFLNQWKLPSAVFFPKKYLIMPDPNLEIYIVIGKGLQLPRIEKPTKEQVDKYHTMYLEELTQLFERNKDKYDPGSTLRIMGPGINSKL